ncbi:hypothetical protein EBZ80_04890 [bacterium]|nr:hypothetical protein [bacterium]
MDTEIINRYLKMFPHKNRVLMSVGTVSETELLPWKSVFAEVLGFETDGSYEGIHYHNHVFAYDARCWKGRKVLDVLWIDELRPEAIETLRTTRPLVRVGGSCHAPLGELGYLPFFAAGGYFYCPDNTLNLVPRILFCLWTGDNAMSANRAACLEDVRERSGVNVRLLTPDNVDGYTVPDFPLHPAYAFLSATHKADYLRMYLMHFYGGGYTDVKRQRCDWNDAYDRLLADPELVGVGYPEIGARGVACDSVREHWDRLVGTGAFLFRPNTAFTRAWFGRVTHLLDEKLGALRTHPASGPADRGEDGHGYPIEWTEILGRIFHPLNDEFHERIARTLVCPELDWWSYH